ncbi:MAG: phosphorothioated DNA-binding restriction endonuclease [Bryobacteraceae bacterium]
MESAVARKIRQSVETLAVWKRGDERAPHKPLLILWNLGRVQRGEDRMVLFRDAEPGLRRLLEEFGPPRKSIHPEYPFWHLQSDGLWEVMEEKAAQAPRKSPTKKDLMDLEIQGGFPVEIDAELRNHPALLSEIALRLLSGHFPESLHGDILEAVGLRVAPWSGARQEAAPFRQQVLDAYGHACALCGYSVRLGRGDLALGAAHLRRRASGGADAVDNGLAVCAIHHKALDRGAVTLDAELRILVSDSVEGERGLEEWFLGLAGRRARIPERPEWMPAEAHLTRHRKNVFRGSMDPPMHQSTSA